MDRKAKELTISGMEYAQEVAMSCPYFKEGYIGVCIASELRYVPSIVRMEQYCFKEHYRFCPNLNACMPGNGIGREIRDSSHEVTRR